MLFDVRRPRARRESTVLVSVLLGGSGWASAACSSDSPPASRGAAGSAAVAGTGPSTGGAPSDGGSGLGGSTAGVSAGTNGVGGMSSSGGQAGKPAGGAAGAPVMATKAPLVSALVVEPNPNNTLSCYVSWTTDVAADSKVQFGDDAYEFQITQTEAVTAHRVLVIGMHADTAYRLRAVSSNSAGVGSAEGSFTTGALPAGLPVATQTASDTSGADAGWTLVNIMPAGSNGFVGTEPGIMAMYDMQGLPVWYYVNGTTPDERGDVSLRVLADHHIVLGPSSGEPAKELDLAGNVVWQGPPPAPSGSSSDPATAAMSHYAGKLENGNYVVFRNLTNSDGRLGALIQELSPANEVVWSWNLFDHIQPPADAPLEWCHPNSLTVDLANDVFYLSCRYQGIIKAKRSGDQAVLWVLGGEKGGDFAFDPTTAAIFDQHDPEIHADGTILVFDNHNGYGHPPDGTTSRAIEFKLDEGAKVATPTFEFPGSYENVDDWYKTSWLTPYWGDADRLSNGNVLICAGLRVGGGQTHVFEVRPSDGAVVWQITLPVGYGSYQAERLSPPPLVEAL